MKTHLLLKTHQSALSSNVGDGKDILGIDKVSVKEWSKGNACLEEDTSTRYAIGVEEPSTEDTLSVEEVDLEMEVQSTKY